MSRPKSPEHKAKLQEILKAVRAKFAEERAEERRLYDSKSNRH
jgi:hypothetical protein